jgi:hypothetical protein
VTRRIAGSFGTAVIIARRRQGKPLQAREIAEARDTCGSGYAANLSLPVNFYRERKLKLE